MARVRGSDSHGLRVEPRPVRGSVRSETERIGRGVLRTPRQRVSKYTCFFLCSQPEKTGGLGECFRHHYASLERIA